MAIDVKIKEDLRKYLMAKLTKDKFIAVLITAYKLPKKEIEVIKKQATFLKDYKMVNVVNKDIIGGMIIKFGTKIIDLSLRGQLKNFRKLTYEIN